MKYGNAEVLDKQSNYKKKEKNRYQFINVQTILRKLTSTCAFVFYNRFLLFPVTHTKFKFEFDTC